MTDDDIHTLKSCKTKEAFPSKGLAFAVAKRMKNCHRKTTFHVYKCKICHQWHIGGESAKPSIKRDCTKRINW